MQELVFVAYSSITDPKNVELPAIFRHYTVFPFVKYMFVLVRVRSYESFKHSGTMPNIFQVIVNWEGTDVRFVCAFVPALSLSGSRGGWGVHIWAKVGASLDGLQVHRRALYEHLWVGALRNGTLTMLWRSPGTFLYYQKTFHVLSTMGAQRRTLPFSAQSLTDRTTTGQNVCNLIGSVLQ